MVTAIYALEPMTHLQTADNYPDLVALETVQQFALLNLATLDESPAGPVLYAGNSFPINVGYAQGQVVPDVAAPLVSCQSCQGIDFTNQNSDNESLIKAVIDYGAPGYFVFSAPWVTTQALLAAVNTAHSSALALPSSYQGPNFVYAISIAPSGAASLTTYDSKLQPQPSYPALPPPALQSAACSDCRPIQYLRAFIHSSGHQHKRNSLPDAARRGSSHAHLGRRQLCRVRTMAGARSAQCLARQNQPRSGLFHRSRTDYSHTGILDGPMCGHR